MNDPFEALSVTLDEPKHVRAYTQAEAEQMSGGMDFRTMFPTIERYQFLACQIGELIPARNGAENRFHLMAFGATWNAALHMFGLRTRNMSDSSTGEPVNEKPIICHKCGHPNLKGKLCLKCKTTLTTESRPEMNGTEIV